MENIQQQIEHIVRRESGQVIASLIGSLGDFDLAEDVWQDALVAALEHWPDEGIPANPGGWLMTTARRKAIDRIRRSRLLTQRQEALQTLASQPLTEAHDPFPDERLKLLFTCCHPALNVEARIALTLHTLGGLSTAAIAHAFFVTTPTMAQRLTRAKQKIRDARIPYQIPALERLPERVPALLVVLYLIFNAGYTATEGDSLMRADLCQEAIRLTRVLHTFLARVFQEDPEVLGLLALMLLQHARSNTRLNTAGEVVLLEDQDRQRWDQAAISEGVDLVERALTMKALGPYQVQAAIAALHAQAKQADETDWPQIAALYAVLGRLSPSPVVELNRAVAIAMADGPLRGLALLQQESLAAPLQHYHWYHAARADLLRRVGKTADARAAYEQALALCHNGVEHAFLMKRCAELA